MNKKISISAVVSVFNGEKILDGCLKSVSFADEIIAVDNSSTDRTLDVAKRHTDLIFTKPNNPMLNVNKNYGFSKATGDWILSLDADERATTELAKEIKEKIGNWKLPASQRGEEIGNSDVVGYWIPRKNIIFGKWMEHTGWYPDYQLRLFKKDKGRFPQEHVHEMVKVEGEVEYLKNHIVHYNYENTFQFLNKMTNIYVPNETEQLIKNGYKFNWQDAIRFPIKEFLSRFFAREGYRDGFHGLMLSIFMAFYHFVVFANMWEKRGFEKIEKNLMEETAAETKKAYRDFILWIGNEKLKTIVNPFKKIAYKVLRKIRKV